MALHFSRATLPPKLLAVARAAFGAYTGNKFKVEFATTVDCARSAYWSGGTRSYYTLISLETHETLPLPSQHPVFDEQVKGANRVPLDHGVAAVEHCMFCGKDMGLVIYLHPDFSSQYLPEPVELTEPQARCLEITCSLKSFARLDEWLRTSGQTKETWEYTKGQLIQMGLLNKAGAVTPAGRNAREACHGRRYELIESGKEADDA